MDKNDNEKVKKYLVSLLTLFQDKPNILAQYLIECEAFTSEFISIILSNERLDKINRDLEDGNDIEKPFFKNVSEMQKYYSSAFKKNNMDNKKNNSPENISIVESLNKQLDEAILNEEYEKAAKLRDYMILMNIERVNSEK